MVTNVTISTSDRAAHTASMLGGTTTNSPARENGVAAKLVGREQGMTLFAEGGE